MIRLGLAKYFRTPNINIKRNRVKDGKTEKSIELILLEELNYLIENGKPVSKSMLSRKTGVGGNSFKTYSYIFDDTIDMEKMFELGTKDKEGNLANVPNADEIADKLRQLLDRHVKKIDKLCDLDWEIQRLSPGDSNIYSRHPKKFEELTEAFFGFIGETAFIDKAFIGAKSLDDIDNLIREKFLYNQTLREKLIQLEKQIAEENKLLKSRRK